MTARTREVHNRKPTEFRKGKKNLKTLSIKSLSEILDKNSKGKKADAVRKEIARQTKKS